MKGTWQLRRTEAERRKTLARTYYDFEMECRKQGWGDPAFVYDEAKDLFRWTDGRFAFSREHADWKLLRKRGRLSEAAHHDVVAPGRSRR